MRRSHCYGVDMGGEALRTGFDGEDGGRTTSPLATPRALRPLSGDASNVQLLSSVRLRLRLTAPSDGRTESFCSPAALMPHYHFHIDQPRFLPDIEGRPLPDVAEAKSAAIEHISQTLGSDPETFWSEESHSVRVTDENNLTLFLIDLTTTKAVAVSTVLPLLPR